MSTFPIDSQSQLFVILLLAAKYRGYPFPERYSGQGKVYMFLNER